MNYKQKFKQFGYWGNSRIGTEFPCVAAGVKGAEVVRPYLDPLTDEEGELIDNGLCLLRNLNPNAFEAFVLHYVKRVEPKVFFAQLKRSGYQRLNEAEAFLIGYLVAKGKVMFY